MGHGAAPADDQMDPRADEPQAALKPEEPSLSAWKWVRKNLFSSFFNSVLTVVFGLLILLVARGLLNFAFSEEREWDAVRTNLRLIFTHAYPEDQYSRVWGLRWDRSGAGRHLAGLARQSRPRRVDEEDLDEPDRPRDGHSARPWCCANPPCSRTPTERH